MPDDAPLPDDLRARLRSYETLVEISRRLLGTADLGELLGGLARELKELVPHDALTVYRLDAVTRMLVPMHSVDDWADEIMAAPFSVDVGVTGWAIRHGEPQHIPANHVDPRLDRIPGTDDEPEALAAVPFVVRGAPIGALNVYRLGAHARFSDEEFELICRFADLAALALDNAQGRERLLREAQCDGLTGLFNHRYFHEQLRTEADRAGRYGRPLSLVAFDIDDFKLLNDAYGHQEGDLALQRVAAAAAEGLRAADVACRVGGEEFTILLPETDKRQARAVASRLCARVRAMAAPRPVTISCGVATFPADGASPAELLAAADAALYEAKGRGKDRVASYTRAVRSRRSEVGVVGGRVESLGQMRTLGNIATRLARLHEPVAIAEAVVADIGRLVEHHDARVYLLDDDGETLEPLAWGGTEAEYRGLSAADLRLRVGRGIAGTAVASNRTLNVGDVARCEHSVQLPGTPAFDESLLAVPLRVGHRVVGVLVVSHLGLHGFSAAAVRLVEILAAQAAVALDNALGAQRGRRRARAAEIALEIARLAAEDAGVLAVLERLTAGACEIAGAPAAAVVDRRGASAAVVAAHGDARVRALARAVLAAGPTAGRVVPLPSEALPAVSAEALGELAEVVAVPCGELWLVVAGRRFERYVPSALASLARAGELAARTAGRLAAEARVDRPAG